MAKTDSSRRDPEEVKRMFGRVAPAYDVINRAMCGGLDVLWRRRLVKALTHKKCACGISRGACKCKPAARSGAKDSDSPPKYIDIACGSGDVALAVASANPNAKIVGADFCAPMLDIARAKTKKAGRTAQISYIEADCEKLPFDDCTFDGATISFGFRNFRDRPKCLREIARVLKPGARLCILEVARAGKLMGPVQAFFMGKVVPCVAGVFGGSRDDYVYLAKTTMEYPRDAEIEKMFSDAGFREFSVKKMGFGLVGISCGRK